MTRMKKTGSGQPIDRFKVAGRLEVCFAKKLGIKQDKAGLLNELAIRCIGTTPCALALNLRFSSRLKNAFTTRFYLASINLSATSQCKRGVTLGPPIVLYCSSYPHRQWAENYMYIFEHNWSHCCATCCTNSSSPHPTPPHDIPEPLWPLWTKIEFR